MIASTDVPDEALLMARDIMGHMLAHRPDVRDRIIHSNIRVAVMSQREVTTDIPEHRDLAPKAYWDKRARGLGATAARPATSCAEENLLGYPDDPYRGENILIHEFGHTIHEFGLRTLDPSFDDRLKSAFNESLRRELWSHTYAATNVNEYWAEGVQSWFDANLSADPPDGIHNRVCTREGIQQYDPGLARLLADSFPHEEWRWTRNGSHAHSRERAKATATTSRGTAVAAK